MKPEHAVEQDWAEMQDWFERLDAEIEMAHYSGECGGPRACWVCQDNQRAELNGKGVDHDTIGKN